jgi:hypothetical protein
MKGTTLEHTSDERVPIPEINKLVCTRHPGHRRNDHGLKSVIISDERDYFRDFLRMAPFNLAARFCRNHAPQQCSAGKAMTNADWSARVGQAPTEREDLRPRRFGRSTRASTRSRST